MGYPPWNKHGTWKWMVGIRSFPFWGPAYFQGLLLLVLGSVFPTFRLNWCSFTRISGRTIQPDISAYLFLGVRMRGWRWYSWPTGCHNPTKSWGSQVWWWRSEKTNPQRNKVWLRYTPRAVTVTTRIITFLVGNSYKPLFATVTGRGVVPRYGLIKGYCNHWFPLLVSLNAFFLGRKFLGNTGGLGSWDCETFILMM